MIDKLCTPAILYLGLTLTQVIIDTYKGMYNAAFLKTLVMVVMTLVLNILCKRNFTLIAWLIVFIPFILMTYITSILFFVFGLSPSKEDGLNYEVDYPVIRNPDGTVYVESSSNYEPGIDNSTKDGTTGDDYDPNDLTSGTPDEINNYNE